MVAADPVAAGSVVAADPVASGPVVAADPVASGSVVAAGPVAADSDPAARHFPPHSHPDFPPSLPDGIHEPHPIPAHTVKIPSENVLHVPLT